MRRQRLNQWLGALGRALTHYDAEVGAALVALAIFLALVIP